MTKIERTMAMLREQERNRRPSPKMPPPKWDMRYKLAIAAMRSDRQVKCQNCIRRYRPCEFYRDCKTEDGNRIYFHPKEDLLRQHLRRVDAILNEAQTLIRKKPTK